MGEPAYIAAGRRIVGPAEPIYITNMDELVLAIGTAEMITLLNEILEEVEEIDQHIHNIERWWGALAAPDETNAIEANVNRPFAVTSGANTWGAAIPILGTDDNPVLASQLVFDPHRVQITDLDDDTTPWRLRFIYGRGTSAEAIAAEQWSEFPAITNAVPGNRAGGVASNAKMIPLPVGIKLWAQAWNDTLGEILSLFWGAHGYPAPTFS